MGAMNPPSHYDKICAHQYILAGRKIRLKVELKGLGTRLVLGKLVLSVERTHHSFAHSKRCSVENTASRSSAGIYIRHSRYASGSLASKADPDEKHSYPEGREISD